MLRRGRLRSTASRGRCRSCAAPLIFAVDVGVEDQFRIGRAMQPAIGLDLGLELARRPAGIAERKDALARPGALGDGLQDVERRGQADAVVDRQRRVVDKEIARMQDEAAARLTGPPFSTFIDSTSAGQLDALGFGDDVELHEEIRKIDGAGGLVDDDAHGAFRGMGADIDHASARNARLPSAAWQPASGRRDNRARRLPHSSLPPDRFRQSFRHRFCGRRFYRRLSQEACARSS